MKAGKATLIFQYLMQVAGLLLLLAIGTSQSEATGKSKNPKPIVFKGCRAKITQGISGQIRFFMGNNMPRVGVTPNKGRPVVRTILIYELTKRKDVSFDSAGFFSKPNTKLMAKGISDENGCFKVALPPGKYSMFVLEKDGNRAPGAAKEDQGISRHYANLFDDDSIFPIEIKEGEISSITFKITYRASF